MAILKNPKKSWTTAGGPKIFAPKNGVFSKARWVHLRFGFQGSTRQKWRQELLVFSRGKCVPSLKLTAKAPKNGWLEYIGFLLGRLGLFSGAKILVSGSVNLSFSEGWTQKVRFEVCDQLGGLWL